MGIALIISLTFNVAGALYWLYKKRKRLNMANGPGWAEFIDKVCREQHDNLPVREGDTVFVGTSLTAGLNVYELFHNLQIKNRGIGSNRTSHIKNRIQRLAEGRPRTIFLEAGINDLEAGITVEETLSNLSDVAEMIRALSPETAIILTSLLPTSGLHAGLNEKIIELNKGLKTYCELENIDYLNLYPKFVIDGELKANFTTDGIHLSFAGYRIWATEVEKILFPKP